MESHVRMPLDDKVLSSLWEHSRGKSKRHLFPTPGHGAFTSFYQLVVPVAEPLDLFFRTDVELSELIPVTYSSHQRLRSKPTSSGYLLQSRSAFSSIPGWVLPRKYPTPEAVEAVLSLIAKISSAIGSRDLISWRGQTKESLKPDLERYLNSALMIHDLAECEGMKRFLDKHKANF